MYETSYHKPGSLAEAKALLTGEAKLLSGGHTLLPTMKQRLAAPSHLIDVTGLSELQGISVEGNAVIIGAATRHADVAGHAGVKSAIPALAHLAGHIGDPHVRNMGTLGGSVANNDPAADYPAAVLGLNGQIKTDQRTIDADDYFKGMFETALRENEIILSIRFSVPAKAGYAKFANPASRYAMCGVLVAKMGNGTVRVAVTGASQSGVYRDAAMEQALTGNFAASAIDGVTVDASHMISDIHGSAEYRANLVKVMARRAIAAAG